MKFLQNTSLNKLGINKFVKKKVLLISLCGYQSFTVRLLHSIIKKYALVKTVFFKRNVYVRDVITISEKEYEYLIKLVEEFEPGLIGISFRSPFLPITKEIIKRVRKVSDALIMLGGTHTIICPEECIKYVDMVCPCEGEIPVKNFFEKNSLDGFWVNKNGKVYKSHKRILTENLDELPVPNFENENKYYIERGRIHFGDPIYGCRVYHIMGSRGCPFNCSYCINSNLRNLYHGQKYLRLRSVDSVMNELNAIKKRSKNLKRILFMDEIFALGNKKWMEEFIMRYKKEINLPFGISYRPDIVKEDVLKLLKEGGLDNAFIGIESGSERVRKEIFNRHISDEQILKCQKILKKVGIIGVYNLIVENPLETVEDLKKGFELIIKFPRPFSFHIFKLAVFPKTELAKRFITKWGKESFNESLIYTPSKIKEEDFWINLISLSSKEFIPKKVLIFISRNSFFIKHQFFVYSLTRVSNWIKFVIEGFRFVLKEGFSYRLVLTVCEDFKKFWSLNR